jgi:hypothetical protein
MRSLLYSVLGAVSLFALAAAPRAESSAAWLDRLNFYRAAAALPPVTEDTALSGGVRLHARYMLAHGVVQHSEDRRRRWATPEGDAAAGVSNLAASTRATDGDEWAVDLWMQAPFHALGMLDPALRTVGFAIAHAERGKLQTAAGLDVIRGRSAGVPDGAYPILWPANGATVPIAVHTAEYPNPLSACPGYEAPAGLPLIVQIGSGTNRPLVAGSWIVDGETTLEHCIFDESSYRNRDAVQQQLGRRILASRNAIVLIPREPLTRGYRYRAVVEVNGQLVDWTFSIN